MKCADQEWSSKTHKAYILSCYEYVKRIVCKLVLNKSCGNVDWVCVAHDSNSEHGAAIIHYILQKKRYSLFWTLFCVINFVSCNAVNLYKAAIISFYATLNGSNSVQFHVMSEHNCHYCGAFTEQH